MHAMMEIQNDYIIQVIGAVTAETPLMMVFECHSTVNLKSYLISTGMLSQLSSVVQVNYSNTHTHTYIYIHVYIYSQENKLQDNMALVASSFLSGELSLHTEVSKIVVDLFLTTMFRLRCALMLQGL